MITSMPESCYLTWWEVTLDTRETLPALPALPAVRRGRTGARGNRVAIWKAVPHGQGVRPLLVHPDTPICMAFLYAELTLGWFQR